jgi:coenzyme Q-binding protein COQ10
MPSVKLQRTSHFTAEQMYRLVGDVANYDLFLPYCVGARVISREMTVAGDEDMRAELAIRYKVIHERFESRVLLTPSTHTIIATQTRGPFRRLRNQWQFQDMEAGCAIGFTLDYEFRISLFGKIVAPLQQRIVDAMIDAFEARAQDLYGVTSV